MATLDPACLYLTCCLSKPYLHSAGTPGSETLLLHCPGTYGHGVASWLARTWWAQIWLASPAFSAKYYLILESALISALWATLSNNSQWPGPGCPILSPLGLYSLFRCCSLHFNLDPNWFRVTVQKLLALTTARAGSFIAWLQHLSNDKGEWMCLLETLKSE